MNEKLKKDLCIKKGHFLTSMRLLALFLFSGVSLFLNANSNRKEYMNKGKTPIFFVRCRMKPVC